jgi:transcriptional regulator with XRE-family HTH domain
MQQLEAEAIGKRIRQARNERGGMTQDELAAMALISKRALQEYEAGVRIPYRHLPEFSRILNRPTEWFLYGDEMLGALDKQELREMVREVVREEIEAALAPIVARLGVSQEDAA